MSDPLLDKVPLQDQLGNIRLVMAKLKRRIDKDEASEFQLELYAALVVEEHRMTILISGNPKILPFTKKAM